MRLPARTTKYFPVRNKDPAPNIVSVLLTMTFVDSPRFRTALVEPTESDEAVTDDEEPTVRVPDDTLKSVAASIAPFPMVQIPCNEIKPPVNLQPVTEMLVPPTTVRLEAELKVTLSLHVTVDEVITSGPRVVEREVDAPKLTRHPADQLRAPTVIAELVCVANDAKPAEEPVPQLSTSAT